jgi:hypothetical protein
MTPLTAPHNNPAITVLRPADPPQTHANWREELATLAEAGVDLDTLQGFVAGLLGEALDRFDLRREFMRDANTPQWEYWRGRNSTIDDFRKQRAAIREEYGV